MNLNPAHLSVAAALAATVLGGCALATQSDATTEDATAANVVATYADIAHAGYMDSLDLARELDAAIDALIQSPNDDTLAAAKAAWLAARVPYQQTEVYRFGNAIVDDWEGKVNAWPLDEGLIDYVDASYGEESDENALYVMNVIANPSIMVGGMEVDASSITPTLLAETLHEADEVEANVATGYHAIEFLLWGQDLNGVGPGAGARPASDYDLANCTGGNCDRRAEYLKAASTLMISDLEEMVANWAPGGAAREAVTSDPAAGLSAMLTGMGSLSYGELAGERMQLGLLLHDPEEEHDCFSDNTHNSHYYDQIGIRNVYTGAYRRVDGSTVSGASVGELVAAVDADLHAETLALLDESVMALDALRMRADGGESYDQMIGEGNADGNAAVQAAIDALVTQTTSIERVVATLDLGEIAIEGSDSLDDPGAVFE